MTRARAAAARSISNAMENKILQTYEDLQKQLKEQLKFLELSADAYDKGLESEAKRMATTIRVLLHDTSKSRSLLGQLNLLDGKFFSTCTKMLSVSKNQQYVGGYAGLVGILIGPGPGGYVPNFDDSAEITGYIDFKDYWDEIIFIDKEEKSQSRKDIILSVADQDGGAHVDPGLNERYSKLSRSGSLGWLTGDGEKWTPAKGAELAAVRQIAHELFRTLIPNYITPKRHSEGAIMGGQGIIVEYADDDKFKEVKSNPIDLT